MFSDNPMWEVYHNMPNFTEIGYHKHNNSQNTSDVEMELKFWRDPSFGGPLTKPIRIFDTEDDETPRKIHNDVTIKLQDDWCDKGDEKSYGFFILRNVQSNSETRKVLGKFFVDAYFFATNLDRATYDRLVELNNTKASMGEKRKWVDYSPLINGYGRLIFYRTDLVVDSEHIYDPNDPENIEVYEVYETYLDNGLADKEP